MHKTPLYPEPNPVNVGAGQLKWAQEQHETNVRAAAEQAGIFDPKPKKPKWWQWWRKNKADTEPKQPQQQL